MWGRAVLWPGGVCGAPGLLSREWGPWALGSLWAAPLCLPAASCVSFRLPSALPALASAAGWWALAVAGLAFSAPSPGGPAPES